MATALIISVGGSMEPVVYSIRQRAPDCVCFLASQRSVDLIAEIKRAASQTAPDRKIIVDDAEDLAHCYEKALECFDWVEHQLPGCSTIVDVTGGTKAMSAALAIAAVARGGSFSYVGGERRDRGGLGVVETGSERLRESVNPWELFAVEEQRIIARAFNSFQYEAAAQTVADTVPRMRDPDRALLEPVGDAARGYLEWDRFWHAAAVQHLKDAGRKLSERLRTAGERLRQPFATFHEQLALSLANLNALRAATRDFNKIHPRLAVDLVANAQRRIEEGRFDDATARLYRALELLGQCAFEKHLGASTGDAPLERLPEQLRSEYERKYRSAEGKLELPLFAAFEALEKSGVEIGQRFAADFEAIKKVLSGRNNSILAHGVQPISRHAAESFMEILKRYLPTNAKLVEFPKLNL
ncbi:MAG: TIGR02710 family CRISPR-associated protein [Deltaproteobacteria bacterium]|nr:TIGR02710 family CRISPR-associated protein [Deltaproteobacteria bacterium]